MAIVEKRDWSSFPQKNRKMNGDHPRDTRFDLGEPAMPRQDPRQRLLSIPLCTARRGAECMAAQQDLARQMKSQRAQYTSSSGAFAACQRTPMRGIFLACWACAASGHTLVTPPKSAMKSRLLMSAPGLSKNNRCWRWTRLG
jgi:hypothetical protein